MLRCIYGMLDQYVRCHEMKQVLAKMLTPSLNSRYNFNNRQIVQKIKQKQCENKNGQSKRFLLHLTKMVPNNCLPSHISKLISGFYSSCFLRPVCYQYSTQNGGRRDIKGDSCLDLTPPNKTPMLLNTSTECNLLTLAGAHRGSKLQLRQVILHGNYSCPC